MTTMALDDYDCGCESFGVGMMLECEAHLYDREHQFDEPLSPEEILYVPDIENGEVQGGTAYGGKNRKNQTPV